MLDGLGVLGSRCLVVWWSGVLGSRGLGVWWSGGLGVLNTIYIYIYIYIYLYIHNAFEEHLGVCCLHASWIDLRANLVPFGESLGYQDGAKLAPNGHVDRYKGRYTVAGNNHSDSSTRSSSSRRSKPAAAAAAAAAAAIVAAAHRYI